jgi:hypothetical protein
MLTNAIIHSNSIWSSTSSSMSSITTHSSDDFTRVFKQDLTANKIFSSVHIEKDAYYATKKNESFHFIDVLPYKNTTSTPRTSLISSRRVPCPDAELRINKRRTFYKWSAPRPQTTSASQERFALRARIAPPAKSSTRIEEKTKPFAN